MGGPAVERPRPRPGRAPSAPAHQHAGTPVHQYATQHEHLARRAALARAVWDWGFGAKGQSTSGSRGGLGLRGQGAWAGLVQRAGRADLAGRPRACSWTTTTLRAS